MKLVVNVVHNNCGENRLIYYYTVLTAFVLIHTYYVRAIRTTCVEPWIMSSSFFCQEKTFDQHE